MVLRLIKFVVFAFGVIFVKVSNVAAFDDELKGLAVQEKLRVPVYYAAISGLPPTSVEDYVSNPMPFKMEARYIVDRFSARRNNQLWLNAILTSNSRDKLKTFENSLLQFSRLIKNDMFKGDRLVFDLNPVHGTAVSINDIELGVIQNLDFQTALVSIWFGEKQPSKKFAKQIRKSPSSRERKAFQALKIQPSRAGQLKALQTRLLAKHESVAQVSKGDTVKNAGQKNVAAGIEKTKVAAAPTAVSSNKKQSATNANNNSNKVKVAKAEQTKPAKVEDKIVKKQPPKTKTPAAKNTDSGAKEQTAKRSVANNNQSANVAKQKQPEKTKNNQPEATKVAKLEAPVSVVDQMFAMLKQDYQAELKQYIEQNAKPAPPIRVRKKPKGQATLRLSVVNDGNKLKVTDSNLIKGEFDGALLEALHKSVRRLQSMPPIPEAIANQSMEIEVTLDFSRCKRSTSAWICF